MDRVSALRVYREGATNRAEGMSHLENPYPVGTPSHDLWFRGWGGGKDPRVAPQFTTRRP